MIEPLASFSLNVARRSSLNMMVRRPIRFMTGPQSSPPPW
jgi:hypothetical protein